MSNFHFAEKLQKLCFFPVFCYILLHILCRPLPNNLILITDLGLNILGVTSGVTDMSKFKIAEKWPKTPPVFCYIMQYILCRLLPNDLIPITNLGLNILGVTSGVTIIHWWPWHHFYPNDTSFSMKIEPY